MALLLTLTLGVFVAVSKLLSLPPTETTGGGLPAPGVSPGGSPVTGPQAKGKLAAGREMADVYALARNLADRLEQTVGAGDWAAAREQLAELQALELSRPAGAVRAQPAPALLGDFFDFHLISLDRALAERNARAAALSINQLAGIIGERLAGFDKRAIAPELHRMRYLAREIELWSADEKMLATRAAALDAAWLDARRAMGARAERETAVRQMDALLQQIHAAKQPREMTSLIQQLRPQIANLDSLSQPARKTGAETGDDK
ncbi:MAG: hypothetical protein ACKV2V_24980 [Blastocatellia bacterium]